MAAQPAYNRPVMFIIVANQCDIVPVIRVLLADLGRIPHRHIFRWMRVYVYRAMIRVVIAPLIRAIRVKRKYRRAGKSRCLAGSDRNTACRSAPSR